MKKLSFVSLIAVAALAFTGCKKEEKAADPAPTPTPTPAVDPKPEPTPEPTPEPAAMDDKADWLKVTAQHTEEAKGPVDVIFKGIKVTKAEFDPAVVEGGSAAVEIDLNMFASGIEKRDGHLKSPDYLDTAKFATATATIDNVKKTGENQYSADATIKARDIEKKYPTTFEVVETMADGIRVKGEVKFNRLDFGVGKAEGDGAAPELVSTYQLTLKKLN